MFEADKPGQNVFEIINEILLQARRENRSYLMEQECKAIFEEMGIATTGHLVAGSEEEAVEMADDCTAELATWALALEGCALFCFAVNCCICDIRD